MNKIAKLFRTHSGSLLRKEEEDVITINYSDDHGDVFESLLVRSGGRIFKLNKRCIKRGKIPPQSLDINIRIRNPRTGNIITVSKLFHAVWFDHLYITLPCGTIWYYTNA